VSGLPAVVTTAAAPLRVTPKNVCPAPDARHASTATWTSPSVPFLKPTGIDRPEASWRCTWLSVVRAPIAPQVTASAMYCGVIGSSHSQPTGRPSETMSISNCRAARSPRCTSWPPSMSGSLIRPFQPVTVRGFSKYTRITISRSAMFRSASACSRPA
jgi:hypothetical protein